MKREGRQHGMVRTHMILPLNHSNKLKLNSPPTAGLFTRVTPKPTNHSKFTGKCGGHPRCLSCHHHPTTKSKNKAKGTNKLKSNDVVCNARMVSWRVVDGQRRLKSSFSGFSASRILDQLEDRSLLDHDDVDHSLHGDGEFQSHGGLFSDYVQKEPERESLHAEDLDHDDDDDNDMSSWDLGFVLDDEIDGDDGWCLVEEM